MAFGRVLAALALLQLLVLLAGAQDDVPEFGKMRVKELKKLLDERGVECQGCVEKDHLVARIKETYHLPVLSEEEVKEREQAKVKPAGKGPSAHSFADKNKFDDADIQKLMDELKKSGGGFDNFKMYTPDDLKKYDFGDLDKGNGKPKPNDEL